MFGGNYYYPQYQQPQAQQQAQGAGNNMVWVQGLAGAKGYPVAAGSAVWMMDSEDKRFYLKSTDATGIPNPLRIFEYREVQEQRGEPTQNAGQYVTRKEFEQRLAALMGGKENE